MRSFLKLSFVFSVLRRRVLKSSAEREQLLQQLTQRGGQKKSEQPPFGKKFTGPKISSRVKEAALGFETRETTDVFSFLEQSIFLHRHLRYIFIKKLLSRCSFVCTATTLKLRRRIVSSSLTRVIHHQRSWWWFMYT